MGRKYTKSEVGSIAIYSAEINDIPENSSNKNFLNPAPEGAEAESIPTVCEALQPTCPDPSQGFQPLSDYLVERITKRVMHSMKTLCKERGAALDLHYWKAQTRFVLAPQSTEDVLIVSSPAGSGKSTWIEAFTRTIVEMFRDENDLASSLVGIAVVLQKVEDLNRLAGVLNSDAPEDSPNMVALPGWSQSGQKLGFCQNPGISSFDQCCPNSCPHAQTCELLSFRKQAPMAPVVGLTQERFVMLREGSGLDGILYRWDEDGRSRPRRYLIFDEKFQLAQINTLDKDCIDQASMEFSALIEKISASDSQVRSLQQSLSYHIDQPFQVLRRTLCVETEGGIRDLQAGFCALPPEYVEPSRQAAFQRFADFVLCQKTQYATRHLRIALDVMAALYSGQKCLFSKTNGFAVTHISPPPLRYGESQSVIFDATSEIDQDYLALRNAVFSEGLPRCEKRRLVFHIYSHEDFNVSKNAMGNRWKIGALGQFIADQIKDAYGDVFLCSYKSCAEELAKTLQAAMPPEDFCRILLMPDRELPTIPYFGGTNGSNIFNTATEVFVLAYPRLNPRDYLIHTCTAYGEEAISHDLMAVSLEKLTAKRADFIWTLPCVKIYMAHHLAARLEQEIYRCALRNPDFKDEIHVHFFRPPTDTMEILRSRLKPDDVEVHTELPACVEVLKRSARCYENGPTSYGRLVKFLAGWDGTEISVQQLRSDLEISPAVWKDLMGEGRVKDLLERQQIQRKGRGPNASWVKPGRQLCA